MACTGFRNPALLAKMAATLDEVSGGRLVLGLGSGVPDRDTSWRAFGFDAARPVARYAEAVEVVVRMLREPAVTFDGAFFRTDDAQIIPRGTGDRPSAGPPVWVAGLGDRTSRVAAAFGDAINVNLPLSGPADMDRVVDIAARACEAVGRDPATLELTGWARLVLDEDGTCARARRVPVRVAGRGGGHGARLRRGRPAPHHVLRGRPRRPEQAAGAHARDPGPVRPGPGGHPGRLIGPSSAAHAGWHAGRTALPPGTAVAPRMWCR